MRTSAQQESSTDAPTTARRIIAFPKQSGGRGYASTCYPTTSSFTSTLTYRSAPQRRYTQPHKQTLFCDGWSPAMQCHQCTANPFHRDYKQGLQLALAYETCASIPTKKHTEVCKRAAYRQACARQRERKHPNIAGDWHLRVLLNMESRSNAMDEFTRPRSSYRRRLLYRSLARVEHALNVRDANIGLCMYPVLKNPTTLEPPLEVVRC